MTERAAVPCNGCTVCCQNDLIFLHPECGDDPSQYETMPAQNPVTGRVGLALRHKPDGGCVYLGDSGCSIHERAPAICREFDCRKFYQNIASTTTRAERRRLTKGGGMFSYGVLKAGIARLHTLPDSAPS